MSALWQIVSSAGTDWLVELCEDGSFEPATLGGTDLEVGTVTGGYLGRAEHPGPGWRRLCWVELARRTGDPIVREGRWPSLRSAPDGRTEKGSWASTAVACLAAAAVRGRTGAASAEAVPRTSSAAGDRVGGEPAVSELLGVETGGEGVVAG